MIISPLSLTLQDRAFYEHLSYMIGGFFAATALRIVSPDSLIMLLILTSDTSKRGTQTCASVIQSEVFWNSDPDPGNGSSEYPD